MNYKDIDTYRAKKEKYDMEDTNVNVNEETTAVDKDTKEVDKATEGQDTKQETKSSKSKISIDKDTYSAEEVKKLLQAESDRRVSEALSKKEADIVKKIESERIEAERLASLSADQRMKEELEKEKKILEKERREFLQQKLELQATKELASKNLPIEFTNYVCKGSKDAEEVLSNINTLHSLWTTALETAVNTKLKGSTPSSGSSSSKSKDPFVEGLKKLY